MTAQEMVEDLRDAGLSASRIAKIIGTHPETVTAWQRGANKPHPYARRRLDELHWHLHAWTARATDERVSGA